jgi:hypothetical protein
MLCTWFLRLGFPLQEYACAGSFRRLAYSQFTETPAPTTEALALPQMPSNGCRAQGSTVSKKAQIKQALSHD